jgi:hypothetical protein
MVTVRENLLVEKYPDRLASQHTLVIAYQADGQVQKALKLLGDLLAVREKLLAGAHPDRLTSQHELS